MGRQACTLLFGVHMTLEVGHSWGAPYSEVHLTLVVAEQGRLARCPGLGLEAQLAELSLGRGTRLLVTAISRLPLMTGIII